MAKTCNCTRDCGRCPAFRRECEGCVEPCRFSHCNGECGKCPVRCHRHDDLDRWLANLGGLALNAPLRPQPQFRLTSFFPQLQNQLQVPTALQRAPDVAVAIDKVLTTKGRISRRALPFEYGPRNLRPQWGVNEISRLICLGNCKDHVLESLWATLAQNDQQSPNPWLQLRVLGFDYATSLNFSIYLDDPRMEHLVNVKRAWLTVQQMQATTARKAREASPPGGVLRSGLIPIPHLQWATLLDLERQLDYAQEQSFHTLTMNLQMTKQQTWRIIAARLPLIRERAPDLRFLFSGTASLRRIAEIARTFPGAAFTSVTPHHLAQRYVRLGRDGTRLIKEPVEGHPDLILAHNVRLYQDFLGELNSGDQTSETNAPAAGADSSYEAVTAALHERFGFPPDRARELFYELAEDEKILNAFQDWLRGGEPDQDFCGSFPRWPCSECVPHPTLGELLNQGEAPLNAFLHLAGLARQVNEEIEVFVGEAGY